MAVTNRVLIADPDEVLAGFYGRALADEGFEIATAADALDCVAQLRSFAPEVLVLDPEIPWGGGEGVLAVMHADADVPLVPVIVLAAGHDLEALYRAAAYPISQWHDKPCSLPLLTRSIRQLLSERSRAGLRRTASAVSRMREVMEQLEQQRHAFGSSR